MLGRMAVIGSFDLMVIVKPKDKLKITLRYMKSKSQSSHGHVHNLKNRAYVHKQTILT